MFSIQTLQHFSQIVPRVCTLVLFTIVSILTCAQIHWQCQAKRSSGNRRRGRAAPQRVETVSEGVVEEGEGERRRGRGGVKGEEDRE